MKMKNKKRKAAISLILISGLLAVLACGNNEKNSAAKTNRDNNFTDSIVIELAGFTGKSVFDLTLEKYNVDYVESSVGIFVKAIDSIPSTKNFGWLFSVNDSFVPVGSNDYITNDTDVIKWFYRKF